MSNCKPCSISQEDLPKTGTDCEIENIDPLYDTGYCEVGENGEPIVIEGEEDTGGLHGCVLQADGVTLCPENPTCSPFDLVDTGDSCLIADLVAESLNIGAADINVHRLLGVHEQGLLHDLVGTGIGFSNGNLPNYPAKNAFDKYVTEWRSSQTGNDVIKHAFLGYDFGPIRLDNGRSRYGIETAIKRDISAINFKQGCDSKNRVTKMRVERSDDGVKWYGVTLLDVPDCDGMVKLTFNKTVPSRFWRIRPVQFNGGEDDYWSVQALQLLEYEKTNLKNIQDRIWLENRDLDYDEDTITIKGSYQPIDVVGNMFKFGFMQDLTDTYSIEVSFKETVAALGRPLVIGDILQLPSETQYTPTLEPILKYLEVTDVAWSTNGYTPGWVPTLQRILAKPALASQETQDIFGKLTPEVDTSGLFDTNDGSNKKYQDVANITQSIKNIANTQVPQAGTDMADVQEFSDELLEFSDSHPHMNLHKHNKKRSVYSEDAMPPNGEPYTEGDELPDKPKHGDYHRLTYEKVGKNIAPRLMRYSESKKEWIYLATDRRYQMNNIKPRLQEFLDPEISSVTPMDRIQNNLKKF